MLTVLFKEKRKFDLKSFTDRGKRLDRYILTSALQLAQIGWTHIRMFGELLNAPLFYGAVLANILTDEKKNVQKINKIAECNSLRQSLYRLLDDFLYYLCATR